MTKDVLVSVTGVQFLENMEDPALEVITAGQYTQDDGLHLVRYDEVMEGFEGKTENTYQFRDKYMELTKKGVINVHMLFEEGRKNLTSYATPYGNIMIGIDAYKVRVKEAKAGLKVMIEYGLEVNYEHLAICNIEMNIRPREQKGFSLS